MLLFHLHVWWCDLHVCWMSVLSISTPRYLVDYTCFSWWQRMVCVAGIIFRLFVTHNTLHLSWLKAINQSSSHFWRLLRSCCSAMAFVVIDCHSIWYKNIFTGKSTKNNTVYFINVFLLHCCRPLVWARWIWMEKKNWKPLRRIRLIWSMMKHLELEQMVHF